MSHDKFRLNTENQGLFCDIWTCFSHFFLYLFWWIIYFYVMILHIVHEFFKFYLFFFFFFFDLGFTALSRIFHLYRADRSSKVGENRKTRRKTTWPSVSRTWLSHIWPERGSNHSGEKPNGLKILSLEITVYEVAVWLTAYCIFKK